MLGYITSLLTPTSLFLFLNLIICIILLTSRLTKKHHQSDNEHHHHHHHHHYPLARAPSLLERVKSVNFSFQKFSGLEPETVHATTSQPLDVDQQFYGHHQETTAFVSETSQVLQRAPSLLERVKSIRVPSFGYRSDREMEATINATEEPKPEMDDHHMKRSKSEPKESPPERQSSEKMKKSASEKAMEVSHEELERKEERETVEKRRPATTTSLEKTVSFGDEGVDAKCDDFINRFKQQLKLQRLDSLLRYRDMLKGKQKV